MEATAATVPMEVMDPTEATVAKGATVDTAAMVEVMVEAMADTVDLDTETTTAMADMEGRVASSANLDTEDMEEGTEATEMATEMVTAMVTAVEGATEMVTAMVTAVERATATHTAVERATATHTAEERATATLTAAVRGPTPATRAAVDTERVAVTTAVAATVAAATTSLALFYPKHCKNIMYN